MIVLVLGGTRSGKSAVAEDLVVRFGSPVTYVATGWAAPEDPDMAARIAADRAARPSAWVTVEAGGDLVGALHSYPDGTMLVDALGTWVAAHPDLAVDVDALIAALTGRTGPTVVVSEEVGLAVHPPTEAGRRFVDVMGTLNQAVARGRGRRPPRRGWPGAVTAPPARAGVTAILSAALLPHHRRPGACARSAQPRSGSARWGCSSGARADSCVGAPGSGGRPRSPRR